MFLMKRGSDKECNILYITHSGELLFWLVVILIIVTFASLSYIHKEKSANNDYQIFLQDVDGLIVGSPVRMMGIEVGHVTKIKPTDDEVYVKFVLTNPDVYIPQGTAVTVEFSGMAGSKSLELYLPDKNSESSPLLLVTPPKRLHDALGLLNDMYKKITSIIYTTSSFGNKVKDVELDKSVDVNMDSFLKYSNNFLDESNSRVNNFSENMNRNKNYVK